MPNVIKTGGAGGGTKVFIDGVQSSEKEFYLTRSDDWLSVKIPPNATTDGNGGVMSAIYDNNDVLNFLYKTTHATYDGTKWTTSSLKLPYSLTSGEVVLDSNGNINILSSSSSTDNKKHYKLENGTWTSVSTLPTTMTDGGCFLDSGVVHILFSVYHYKYVDDTWVQLENNPISVYKHNNCVTLWNKNREFHVLGNGQSSSLEHNKYIAETNTWSSVSTLPYETSLSVGGVDCDDNLHYLGSGYNYSMRYYHYIFKDGTWTKLTNAPYEIYYSCYANSNKGRMFFVGSANANYASNAYEYLSKLTYELC